MPRAGETENETGAAVSEFDGPSSDRNPIPPIEPAAAAWAEPAATSSNAAASVVSFFKAVLLG
jgi:hypothetical protein